MAKNKIYQNTLDTYYNQELDSLKRDYDKQRQVYMTDEECDYADRLIDLYRSSWQSKDQLELFDKYEMNENYYIGNVNISEDISDPGSNTNIIHPMIEGQVSVMTSKPLRAEVIAEGPSDADFAEDTEDILNWVADKNKLDQKRKTTIRRFLKFGTAITRVCWDPDFKKGMGLPTIEDVNPAYIYIDPNITDTDKLQEGNFIIETTNKSIAWAKRTYGDIADAILPAYDPSIDDVIFGEDQQESDDISQQNYVHMLVWKREDDDIRYLEIAGNGVILYDSFAEKKRVAKEEEVDPNKVDVIVKGYCPNNKFPYFMATLYKFEGNVWGKSDVDLLKNQQDMINEYDDSFIRNCRLMANPALLVDVANTNVDPEDITNEPGLVIPTDDVNGIKYLQTPTFGNEALGRRKYIMEYERQVVSRISDSMFGTVSKGVNTATEAVALQQTGMMVIDDKVKTLQHMYKDAFDYVLELARVYWDSEEVFRITERDGKDKYTYFNPSELLSVPVKTKASANYIAEFKEANPDEEVPEYQLLTEIDEEGNEVPLTKEADFDIRIDIGAGMPNSKAFLYQAAKEAYAERAIELEEYRRMLKNLIKLPIDIIPPSVKKQEEQQQMAQLQAMQQAPTSGNNNQSMVNSDIEGLNAANNVQTSNPMI